MKWDPTQYLKYSDERFRPAMDLISQINLDDPQTIIDLGCGTGHITQMLSCKWPKARLIGLDSSEEMLEKAKTLQANIIWQHGNIESWEPKEKFDIIFSNSVLHWMSDHKKLLVSLFNIVNPKGILAIQMPNNFREPTHQIAFQIISNNQDWKNRFSKLLNDAPVSDFELYYNLFPPSECKINAWQTIYFHVLEGEDPVVEWVKGSFLKPLLDEMLDDERSLFLLEYAREIKKYYPCMPDGKTILPFKRFFLVISKR